MPVERRDVLGGLIHEYRWGRVMGIVEPFRPGALAMIGHGLDPAGIVTPQETERRHHGGNESGGNHKLLAMRHVAQRR
jgi:hypothetical protein